MLLFYRKIKLLHIHMLELIIKIDIKTRLLFRTLLYIT